VKSFISHIDFSTLHIKLAWTRFATGWNVLKKLTVEKNDQPNETYFSLISVSINSIKKGSQFLNELFRQNNQGIQDNYVTMRHFIRLVKYSIFT